MTADPPPRDALRSEPSPRCIACGGGGLELYTGLTDTVAGAPGRWRMVRCANAACGLLWLDPKPLAEDLLKAYARYHTHGRAGARSPAQLGLSTLNAGCKLVSRLLERGSGLGRQRRALRSMFLGDAPPGRLLEVGCGSGRFLNRMRAAGWDVQGTDFDPAVAARVQEKYELHVDVGDLADLHYPKASYDAVAMSQVIEHVHDPRALLAESLRVLRPGGRLVVTTPNALALAHRLYGRHWRGLEPPRHLHVFSPAALERCATACGFARLELRTLSAESAGIYRAGDEMRAGRASPAIIVRSWRMRAREYRETARDPHAGQDILFVGARPG